jgi:glutathione S-transferase
MLKLYVFSYSPYARKVQMLLDLMRVPYERVVVPYGERRELAELTGGYIYVPVLVDGNRVLCESRDICEHLLTGSAKERFTPAPFQGAIWAYADFADGPLEDVLFRIASPKLREQKADAGERALFTLIKERKFGSGCIELWAKQEAQLLARAKRLLAPTLETLRSTPFLFGKQPTLADAALYGNLAMLQGADPSYVAELGSELVTFAERLEAAANG